MRVMLHHSNLQSVLLQAVLTSAVCAVVVKPALVQAHFELALAIAKVQFHLNALLCPQSNAARIGAGGG